MKKYNESSPAYSMLKAGLGHFNGGPLTNGVPVTKVEDGVTNYYLMLDGIIHHWKVGE